MTERGNATKVDGMSKDKALENIRWAAKGIKQANERADLYVATARQNGASWAEIGARLGISRQAAQKRYGKNEGTK